MIPAIINSADDLKSEPTRFIPLIVSTPLMNKIAENYGVDCKITLTGFKWISKLISENKNIKKSMELGLLSCKEGEE